MASNMNFTTILPRLSYSTPASFHYTLALPTARTVLGYLLPLIPIHLLLVKLFRNHFIRQLQRKHPYSSNPGKGQKPLSEMPLAAAHDVIKLLSTKDFPYFFNLALQFALIRTYAVPTISKLLVKTTQLDSQSRNTVGKRYADTAVIISEYYHNLPGSERSSAAFARLNYLHGHYIRQNRISNDDMLYTLAMFVNQPPEWINKYEFRSLTELELTGIGLFHRFVGEAMQISFDALDNFPPPPLPNSPSNPHRTWRTDGLAFYHSLDAWSKDYEKRVMLPNRESHSITIKTLNLLTSTLPASLGSVVSKTAISMMDTRMREACMLPSPPPSYRSSVDRFLAVRAFCTRHLILPRRALWGWWVPEAERGQSTEYVDPQTGKRWFNAWEALPHYVKPTVWNRWLSPAAWGSSALGVPVPGDEGMESGGWVIGETGPEVFKGKGTREFEEGRRRLEGKVRVWEMVSDGGDGGEGREGSGGGGCPFFVKI